MKTIQLDFLFFGRLHNERYSLRCVFALQQQSSNRVGWFGALKRAGIENFRWHDLRHTWASWLTQEGVPLNVIQEMGAWESAEMVRRYAHLAPEQFGRHAKVVDALLDGTSEPQPMGEKDD